MPINDTQLANLLQRADAQCATQSASLLCAGQLLDTAAARKRRRATIHIAGVSAVLVFVATGYHWWPKPQATVAAVETATADLDKLSAQIAALHRKSDALVARIAETTHPEFDVLSTLHEMRTDNNPSLRQLQTELAALEARAAANDTQLAWDIAWSHSGALRLELARQDAQVDPERAAESYRQIAASYAGTRWGDQAQQALTRTTPP